MNKYILGLLTYLVMFLSFFISENMIKKQLIKIKKIKLNKRISLTLEIVISAIFPCVMYKVITYYVNRNIGIIVSVLLFGFLTPITINMFEDD